MEPSQSSHSIGSFSAKNGPRRRSDYNPIPTLENESNVTARRKSVSIRELAEFARAKSTESHKSIDKDGSPSLSSGISIHDKIRLEALHQAALGDDMGEVSQRRNFEKTVESFGAKKKVESSPQLGTNNPRSLSRLSDAKNDKRRFSEGDFSKARSSARSSSKASRARTPTSVIHWVSSSRATSASMRSSDRFIETEFKKSTSSHRRSGLDLGKTRIVQIPKFNNGGPNNLMQQLEANSWARQMKAYLDAGEVSPSIAKNILSCTYLRLSDSNLEHLRSVLDEIGEGDLVDSSPHSKEFQKQTDMYNEYLY